VITTKSPLAVTGVLNVDSIALDNVNALVVSESNVGVEEAAEIAEDRLFTVVCNAAAALVLVK
jgi:hypothetical protein